MTILELIREDFESYQKNTLLDFDEASWFVQNRAFIPIPRNTAKEDIKVVFTNDSELKFKLNKKISKYKISVVCDEHDDYIGMIIALELQKSATTHEYEILPYDFQIYNTKKMSNKRMISNL